MTRILVVDDENLIRWALDHGLRKHGYEVCCAEDVSTASKVAREGLFDLVISDVRLPDGDGIEWMGNIRPFQPQAKVIIITAYDGVEVRRRAQELGVGDYIETPFSIEEVVRRVEALIGPPKS